MSISRSAITSVAPVAAMSTGTLARNEIGQVGGGEETVGEDRQARADSATIAIATERSRTPIGCPTAIASSASARPRWRLEARRNRRGAHHGHAIAQPEQLGQLRTR